MPFEFIGDVFGHLPGHFDAIQKGGDSSGLALFEAAEDDFAGESIMIAHLVVERKRYVWRLRGVDVQNTIAKVFSRVLAAFVRTSLLYEEWGPLIEIMRIFDPGVFEDDVAMLIELIHIPCVIVHVDWILASLGFECVDVWNCEVFEAAEDVLLEFWWSVQSFFALIRSKLPFLLLFPDLGLSPSVEQRFAKPPLFRHDRSLFVGVFG